MPVTISSEYIIEKNKLNSNGAWLILLRINIEGEDPIYLVGNNEDITWNGNLWKSFYFKLGDNTESKDGDLPTVDLTVHDISKRLVPLLAQYTGAVGAEATVYIVHSSYLNLTSPAFEDYFDIVDTSIVASRIVTFKLGSENLYNYRCPTDMYLKDHCRFREFKGPECQYSGSASSCDRTFKTCISYGNQRRFGGFPGLGALGIKA